MFEQEEEQFIITEKNIGASIRGGGVVGAIAPTP